LEIQYAGITADGCLLLAATDNVVCVVEVRCSRVIEEIPLASPLLDLIVHRDVIYLLGMDSAVVAHDVYSGKSSRLQMESAAMAIALDGRMLAVTTAAQLIFHDLDFNHIRSAAISLSKRSRDQIFGGAKPDIALAITSATAFCGGSANQIRIVRYNRILDGTDKR